MLADGISPVLTYLHVMTKIGSHIDTVSYLTRNTTAPSRTMKKFRWSLLIEVCLASIKIMTWISNYVHIKCGCVYSSTSSFNSALTEYTVKARVWKGNYVSHETILVNIHPQLNFS